MWRCQGMIVWSLCPPLYWCWGEDPRAQSLKCRGQWLLTAEPIKSTSIVELKNDSPAIIALKVALLIWQTNDENQVGVSQRLLWRRIVPLLAKAMQHCHTQLASLPQGKAKLTASLLKWLIWTQADNCQGKPIHKLLIYIRYFKPTATLKCWSTILAAWQWCKMPPLLMNGGWRVICFLSVLWHLVARS